MTDEGLGYVEGRPEEGCLQTACRKKEYHNGVTALWREAGHAATLHKVIDLHVSASRWDSV